MRYSLDGAAILAERIVRYRYCSIVCNDQRTRLTNPSSTSIVALIDPLLVYAESRYLATLICSCLSLLVVRCTVVFRVGFGAWK
jgi:hypothetical protein